MNKMVNVTESKALLDLEEGCAKQESTGLAYEKPILTIYGDVRDVTLGPTAGLGESGCENQRRPGSSLSCP